MAYTYGYSEPYSTADKERSESQKGPRDFFSVFSVSVVETLENEIRFDINFTCKGRSRDRYILFYYINCSVLQEFLPPRNVVSEHT